jgi:hypothetical protein
VRWARRDRLFNSEQQCHRLFYYMKLVNCQVPQFVSHHKTSVQESSCRSLPVIVSTFTVARCRHAHDQ